MKENNLLKFRIKCILNNFYSGIINMRVNQIKKNLITCISGCFFLPLLLMGQEIGEKIYIIDTLFINGKFIHVTKGKKDFYDPGPFLINILVPCKDSTIISTKSGVRDIIYNKSEDVYLLLPSDFFFMLKHDNNMIYKEFGNISLQFLNTKITENNSFHYKIRNANVSIYSIKSRFIIALVDVNLFKSCNGGKLKILKQNKGYVKIVVPIP